MIPGGGTGSPDRLPVSANCTRQSVFTPILCVTFGPWIDPEIRGPQETGNGTHDRSCEVNNSIFRLFRVLTEGYRILELDGMIYGVRRSVCAPSNEIGTIPRTPLYQKR